MSTRWLGSVLLVVVAACGTSAGALDAGAPPDDAGVTPADAGVPADADAGTPPACPQLAEKHARADEALERFLVEFWRGSDQYLRGQVPGDALAHYWVYAQAFDALLDGVERTGGARYRGLIAAFAAGQEARGWSSDYYDDENWLALALLRAYDLTGETAYLERAKLLFADIQAAWDTRCCGSEPGGIWWDRAHTQKATASNGGPVITAARLAARTGDPAYLDFAEQVYAYWRAHMVDPSTFQVADHIAPDGAITRWRFTYNEGVMIGGALALHRATGLAHYLDDARAYADFVRSHETVATPLGPVLWDGSNSGCAGDCQQFKGVGYRYLAELAEVAPAPALDAVLAASAEAAWSIARDPATNHFGTDWSAAPPGGTTTISQMSAALSALALDARRCGAYPGVAPALRFEAEDGVLRRVGLEAGHAGYSGWAYLAGWDRDGQGVELDLEVPAAGSYRLSFRYAGGAGEARRRVAVNGAEVAAALVFPGTSGWGEYADVTLTADLPAGASTLAIHFDAASGSAGILNLDHVDIAPL